MDLTADLVALCHRDVPRDPPRQGFSLATAEDIDRTTDLHLALAEDAPIHIFAYGSLIWKPDVPIARRTLALAQGWHRDFTLRVEGGRGQPDEPSYMLGLARGGRCRGVLLELPLDDRRTHLRTLIAREFPYAQFLGQIRWITTRTDHGPCRAITFWAGRYPPLDALGIPSEEKARHMAVACGWLGSGAEYLYQTVRSLAEHGIHDPFLWRMQAMVAAEIRARHGLPATPSAPAGFA
jgi:cation transport protein ChaC